MSKNTLFFFYSKSIHATYLNLNIINAFLSLLQESQASTSPWEMRSRSAPESQGQLTSPNKEEYWKDWQSHDHDNNILHSTSSPRSCMGQFQSSCSNISNISPVDTDRTSTLSKYNNQTLSEIGTAEQSSFSKDCQTIPAKECSSLLDSKSPPGGVEQSSSSKESHARSIKGLSSLSDNKSSPSNPSSHLMSPDSDTSNCTSNGPKSSSSASLDTQSSDFTSLERNSLNFSSLSTHCSDVNSPLSGDASISSPSSLSYVENSPKSSDFDPLTSPTSVTNCNLTESNNQTTLVADRQSDTNASLITYPSRATEEKHTVV